MTGMWMAYALAVSAVVALGALGLERALERLDEGSYGWCERCGNPIPVERLAAFPSATLCVTCKQLEERR